MIPLDDLDGILDWLSDNCDNDPWCNDVADILLDMDDPNSVLFLIISLSPKDAYEKLVLLTHMVYRPYFIQCKFP